MTTRNLGERERERRGRGGWRKGERRKKIDKKRGEVKEREEGSKER